MVNAISCGSSGSEILATAGDMTVTEDDFRAEFNQLSPSGQVEVLEPFGKLNLVKRLIYERIFLREAEGMNTAVLQDWLEITELGYFSQSWLESRADVFMPEDIDSLLVDSLLRTHFVLSAVLVEDSLTAVQVLDDWIADVPSEPTTRMALASWSMNGSSYIDIQSDLFTFMTSDPVFAGYVTPYPDSGAVMFPAFGAWAVAQLEIDPLKGDAIPFTLDDVAPFMFAKVLADESGMMINSNGIREFASMLRVEHGRYLIFDDISFNPDMQLAVYEGGEVTASDITILIDLLSDEYFFTGIPAEYAFMAFPAPLLGAEMDVWRYVNSIGMIFWETEMGEQNGFVLTDSDRNLTITDFVLREKVIIPSLSLDSIEVMAYYENNAELYVLPELRSAKLVYIPLGDIDEDAEYNSFTSLPEYYSSIDSLGELIPTLTISKADFGPIGDAVFSAELNVFEGPIDIPQTDMASFFEVVEIVPSESSDPSDIYSILYDDCRMSEMSRLLNSYLEELWTGYEVEIDSAVVNNVDPWQSTY